MVLRLKRDRGGVLGQEPAPLLEGAVRSTSEGAAFVGGGYQPEQQLGGDVVERGQPDLVGDDQVVAQLVWSACSRESARSSRGVVELHFLRGLGVHLDLPPRPGGDALR